MFKQENMLVCALRALLGALQPVPHSSEAQNLSRRVSNPRIATHLHFENAFDHFSAPESASVFADRNHGDWPRRRVDAQRGTHQMKRPWGWIHCGGRS